MNAVDHYDWWRRAVAGEKIGGPTLPIHEDTPQQGYYRKRITSGGGFIGVAIYEHGGKLVALEGKDRSVDPVNIWSWVAKYPVSYESYMAWSDSGRWPDVAEAVENSLAHDTSNSAEMTEAEKKKSEIENALAAVEKYALIGSDEANAQAQSARSRLLELMGEADKIREKEKAPHLEAGRKVDATWQPLVKMSKEGADKIRTAMAFWLNCCDRADAETTAAAEAKRVAEEAATAKAAKKGQPAPPPPAPAPAPAPLAPQATTVRGGYGRAASVVEKTVVTVTDQDAAYQSLKAHPELVALIQQLAERAVKAGMADKVQGIKVSTEKDVR